MSGAKGHGAKDADHDADEGSLAPAQLPRCVPLLAPHRAAPPLCHCGARATRRFGRWWCARAAADDGGGCAFELWGAADHEDHDRVARREGGEGGGGEGGEGEGGGVEGGGEGGAGAVQPLCECGLPGAWWRGRWWCPHPNSGAAGCAGCAFEWCPPPARPEPSAVSRAAMESEQARPDRRPVAGRGGRGAGWWRGRGRWHSDASQRW